MFLRHFLTLRVSLIFFRPKDEERINLDGGPANPDEPFDYNAVPTRFFYDVETVGGLDPDQIVTKGINVLQTKLAGIIHELSGGTGGPDGGDFGAQSPTLNGAGYGGVDGGYTPAGGYGGASSYAAQGAATPYGATPYGQPNW